MVAGVGNTLSSDDGAGPAVARIVASRGGCAFECGTAPENFCSTLRSLHPSVLIIADAAGMGLCAGSLRRIQPDQLADVSVGTHMLSLGFFCSYVREFCGEIIIIGIQPASLAFGEELSPEVAAAVAAAARLIIENRVFEIAGLESCR